MDRRCFLIVAALVASISTGCGSKPTTGGAGQQWVENVPTPDATVREFLEAVRKGDDALAELLLTDVAREETRKHDLSVAPPGSDTAKFEVGKVEYVAANEVAHVESVWTDIGEDGQPQSDPIIWMLRRDPAGWRIAGMATKIFKDELPLLLDFENPEDMIRKQQMAEAELQRRAAGGAPNAAATGPAATGPAAPGATKQGATKQGPAAPQSAATAPKGAPGTRAPGAAPPGQNPPGANPVNPPSNQQPANAEKPIPRNMLRQ
jgi:hypothetical protein